MTYDSSAAASATEASEVWLYGDEQPAALDYSWAYELPADPEPEEQLVEGLLGRAAMSVLYGDSNSGKTFLALDLACAVSSAKKWMGRHTMHGMVVYLASESPRSVQVRLQAYQRHHRAKGGYLAIVRSPINLYDGETDAMLVVDLIRRLESHVGVKCEMVIGDTLSRMAAGANENSGEDMGTVLAHAELIRRETDAHVMLIHHSGKDAAKGARGWSGLRAAVDTEIEVTCDETRATRVAAITKQRDIPSKGERIGFKLEMVDMGVGQWGEPRTSCVVVPADAPAKTTKNKRPSEIARTIVEALRTHGKAMKKGDLAMHLVDRYPKSSIYRELAKMADSGRTHEVGGTVALHQGSTVNRA